MMRIRSVLFLVLTLIFSVVSNPSFSLSTAPQIAQDKDTGYDRSLFKHWIDADKDGCDTRAEVLISEAVIKPKVGKNCKITGGKWISAYDGKSITNASQLDVDHLVPLAEAWRSGAWAWTAKQRQDYANDLGDKRALIAVTLTTNRSKSDKDFSDWLPKLDSCGYVKNWIAIKIRYSLTYDEKEAAALLKFFEVCKFGDIPVQALPGYKYQSNQPTPTVVDDLSAGSDFWNRGPREGDDRISSYVSCRITKPREYQAINSYISIFDPSDNLLVRKRLSDIYNPYLNPVETQYWLDLNEMLENSGKTYSCLFDFVRLDGSQVTKELSVKVPSIIKSPLPKPQTVIHSIGRGGLYEVACFLTNWQDYSLGRFKYDAVEKVSRFEPTSRVTLFRDDGSILSTAGFNADNDGRYFKLIPWEGSSKFYLGIYLYAEMYDEIDRAAGKRYTCKYEMVGFNGETLVHTEIVQMPTRYIPPTPTPSPIPTVTPGAFCATAGAIGKSTNGTLYTCKTSDTDTRYRWRQ